MDVSGEVADLMVKETLQAGEAAVRLAASGIKNVAALLLALSQSDRKIVGRTSAKKLTRDPAPAVVLPLRTEDVKRFGKLAKEYGILYVIAKPHGRDGPTVDVISTERYAAKLNALYQSMGYPLPEKEAGREETAKKAGPRAPQERSSPERGSGLRATARTSEAAPEGKPSVRARLAALHAAAKGLEPVEPLRDRNKELTR